MASGARGISKIPGIFNPEPLRKNARAERRSPRINDRWDTIECIAARYPSLSLSLLLVLHSLKISEQRERFAGRAQLPTSPPHRPRARGSRPTLYLIRG